jgi:hypothetical protein
MIEGDHNAACFECGRKRKASELLRHWQGYLVCEEHWEPRHPQDFVRGVPDTQAPAWTQPPGEDSLVAVCTLEGRSAVIDLAIVDCSIIDYVPTGMDY